MSNETRAQLLLRWLLDVAYNSNFRFRAGQTYLSLSNALFLINF